MEVGRALVAMCGTVVVLAAACSGGSDGDERPAGDATTDASVDAGCDWPAYGRVPDRTFALPADCPTTITPASVGDLQRAWFFTTDDVVTATPAVHRGTVYVGDWAGVVYAIDAQTGEERWRHQTEEHPTVYSGQIVSSAAVATVDGADVVFVGAGKHLVALDAETGDEVWAFDAGSLDEAAGRPEVSAVPEDERPTEIQSSPVVVDGKVIVGFDAHDRPGFRGGVVALDAATGDLLWDFDPDGGETPTGCGGVWDSPSVDLDRGLVFAATANCPTELEEWPEYAEAIFALDLDTGVPRWHHQPQEPFNRNDYDFAGAPNLFSIDGVDVVGLGGKSGRYHVLERETGEPVWDTLTKEPEGERGINFSFGGFIGATAVSDGIVAGGTAGNGPTACPCVHALDAATGEILWQADEPQPVYGAAAIAGGVLFAGSIDFTLRAFDLRTGDVLWSSEMPGVVAGGAAVVGDDVFAVAGIREPGTEVQAESAGIARFTLDEVAPDSDSSTTSSTAPAHDGPVVLESPDQPCVGTPCPADFTVPAPPDGLTPSGELLVATDPFSARMVVRGLGDPDQWVGPGAPDADEGADHFALMISVSDEQPIGTEVCTFEASTAPGAPTDELVCEGDTISLLAPQYNRLSIIALPPGGGFPSVAEGVARLVWTFAFDTPLVLVDPPPPGG